MPTTVEPTGNQDIDGILWGWKWISTNLTYSFPADTSDYGGYTDINGFEAFNANQQTAAERALANIASFSGLTFTESTGVTTLRFAEADSVDDGWGLDVKETATGTPPDPNFAPGYAHGDMWFNHTSYNNPTLGSFAYAAGIMHEIGHTLGLKHGHTTQDADHDDHTHPMPELPADHDSYEYSVMTYSQYVGDVTPGDNAPEHPTTYMMNDISALQHLYGANYNFNSGNTTYSWSSTTGEMSINGTGQGAPISNYILMTIWDGGGIDTYDFTNYTSDLTVSLAPGEWTTTSTSQLANLGDGNIARGSIANARLHNGNTASLIENAYGGSGEDTITGNQANNVLKGGGGADTLAGLEGDDFLSGQDGDDTLKGAGGADDLYGGDNNDHLKGGGGADTLSGGSGVDMADYSNSAAAVIVSLESGTGSGGDAAGDTLDDIEDLRGSTEADWLIGDANANELNGWDGDDVLKGGGGADDLIGEDGNDTASYYNSAAGVIVSLGDGSGGGGDAEGDTLTSIENVTGSNHADTLAGNNGANTLSGANGDDTLKGGGGADTLSGGGHNDTLKGGGGADALDGGTGSDTASYQLSTAGVVVSLITDSASGGEAAGDELDNIENLTGSNHADTLWGDNAANTLAGLGGIDTLAGFGGDDTLNGGGDNDSLYGGDGFDEAVFSGPRSAYTLANLGGDNIQVSGTDGLDALNSIEQISFSGTSLIWAPDRANDFNADGISDLLLRSDAGGVASWEFDGLGAYGVENYGAAGSPWVFAASGDFNFDGNSDVLWRHSVNGTVATWELDGAGGMSFDNYGAANLVWDIAGSGDFNGDGRSDVLYRNTSTGAVATWELNGSGGFSFDSYGSTSLAWTAAGTGDFNSDGKDDILWRNTSTGAVATWELNGSGGMSYNSYGAANTVWQMAGSADFNGDAKNDILWRNSVTGEVATWELNGDGGFAFDGYGAAGLNWQVASTGDFNDDGKADILWRNSVTDQVAVWELDGAGGFDFQSYGVAPADWNVFNSFDLV